jgi:hypothetical protein
VYAWSPGSEPLAIAHMMANGGLQLTRACIVAERRTAAAQLNP